MAKQNINLNFRFLNWFTNHPWLKLIALILAVIVWFYARDEIIRLTY